MRRLFFRILDIRKNKPPVSVKYSTIFTFCVPQKFTIYTLEIKKAEQQNRKITKKKQKKDDDNSLFIMNKYNFTNQSNIDNNNRRDHSLVFRQEKKRKKKFSPKVKKTLTSRLENKTKRIL